MGSGSELEMRQIAMTSRNHCLPLNVIWFLVTSLTRAPLSRLLGLAQDPALGTAFVAQNFFYSRMMEAIELFRTLNMQTFSEIFPRSLC